MTSDILIFSEDPVLRNAQISLIRGQGLPCRSVDHLEDIFRTISRDRPPAVVIDAWPGGNSLEIIVAMLRATAPAMFIAISGVRLNESRIRELGRAGADLVVDHAGFAAQVPPALERVLQSKSARVEGEKLRPGGREGG